MTTAEAATLRLEGELTIRQAAACRELMLAALADGVGSFDLAGVTEFDSAGVQLLVAASRSAGELGRPLQLRQAPPVVRDALQSLGLLPLLPPEAP